MKKSIAIVLIVVALLVGFFVGNLTHIGTPSEQLATVTEAPSATPSSTDIPSSSPSIAPTTDSSALTTTEPTVSLEPSPVPTLIPLTPDTFEGYEIYFVPENGDPQTAITTFSDARMADHNQTVIEYPVGFGRMRYDGYLSFDFHKSGKSIESVSIIRFDWDSSYTNPYEFTYDETNVKNFPYPDEFTLRDGSEMYVAQGARFDCQFTFTDGSIFKCVFTANGKYNN